MIGYGNSMFLGASLFSAGGGGGIDPDAQAFITAASITDPTQQSAINQLVVDLKGYSIWTKMKALYPFCGGSASSHKFNLKDPRDLDAAYRLIFSGGWTHSSTGALPNGTNGYATTKFATNLFNSASDFGIGSYTRTNTTGGAEIGVFNPDQRYIGSNLTNNAYFGIGTGYLTAANTDSKAFWQVHRTSSSVVKVFKNASVYLSGTTGSGTLNTKEIYIGALNDNGTGNYYTGKEIAFAFISNGLTDTEATNLRTAVQTFQTTLGRSIGTQTVSDADAQAFVTNAGIVDQVEANAINNLVIGLKADSLWTKMKAVYPFVGGTATTNKYNLKNPLDTDAAYRLVFSGGWTFSSQGALPNGTNAYADTKFKPNVGTLNSNALGYYIRTVNSSGATDPVNMGAFDSVSAASSLLNSASSVSGRLNGNLISGSITGGTGLFSISKTSSTTTNVYKNSSSVGNGNSGGSLSANNVFIGTLDLIGSPYGSGYVNSQFAFVYMSDGLSGTEVTNLNTRVTTFQTALNRNV